MKATYKTFEGHGGSIDYEAIKPISMQHADGFTLLGFNTWEDVDNEKLACAVTNVAEFSIDNPKMKVGFHENKN